MGSIYKGWDIQVKPKRGNMREARSLSFWDFSVTSNREPLKCSTFQSTENILILKRVVFCNLCFQIRKKVALPPLTALPENLLNYSKYGTVFLKPTSSGDHKLDDVSCKTIGLYLQMRMSIEVLKQVKLEH